MKALITFILIYVAVFAKGQSKKSAINVKDTAVYQFAQFPAEYPGGDTNVGKYVINKLSIPADPQNFQSRLAATFIVEKNGTLSHIKIIRPDDKAQAQSFLKVIREMPRWLPAVDHGYIVRSTQSISMIIELASEE